MGRKMGGGAGEPGAGSLLRSVSVRPVGRERVFLRVFLPCVHLGEELFDETLGLVARLVEMREHGLQPLHSGFLIVRHRPTK